MKNQINTIALLFATFLLTLASCSKEAGLVKNEHATKETLDSAWVNHVTPGEIWETELTITYKWAGDTITETLVTGTTDISNKLAASIEPEPNMVIGRILMFTDLMVACSFSEQPVNKNVCVGTVQNGKWKGRSFSMSNLIHDGEDKIVKTNQSQFGICNGPQMPNIISIKFVCKRRTTTSG